MKLIIQSEQIEEALREYFEKRYKLSVRFSEPCSDLTLEEVTTPTSKEPEKAPDELLEKLKAEAKALGVLPKGRTTVEKLEALIAEAKTKEAKPVLDQDDPVEEQDNIPFEGKEQKAPQEEPEEEEKPVKKFLRR